MKNEIIDTHTDRNGNKWERKESRSSWKNLKADTPR